MLRDLLGHGLLNVQVSLQGLTQARQVPIALHFPKPRLDIQQRGGQPALALMGVRPPIDFGTPLFYQDLDGLQAIGGLEGQA